MGRLFESFSVLLCALALALSSPAALTRADRGADPPADNVAVQWNQLYSVLACAQLSQVGLPIEPNIIFSQLHLAQWHALLALKNTGACTTQEVVVAYASHKILSNYFPFGQVLVIDPLLNAQLKKLRVSDEEDKLGRQLGEAVALDLIAKRVTARESALRALKKALDAEAYAPRPGVYRYLNNTPAGRDDATFWFYNIPIARPFVIPEPSMFIKAFLSDLKPPKVPSDQWDIEYEKVKDLGRADWSGRTREMNDTANQSCLKLNNVACFPEETWSAVARATLPRGTSLFDTVTLFAKLSVAMHDTLIVLFTLQYGFWFWRPEMAFKAGDPRHAPIPTWTPYLQTVPHPEYPSGSVSSYAAAATILEDLIGKNVPFTIQGGGVFGPGCPAQGPIPGLNFTSFRDLVRYTQQSRVFAGQHFNKSVVDAVKVGDSVADYVQANWALETPSGVLPNPAYLKVFAELPRVQTDFDPIKLVF
ncbi:hypothetical protein M758_10G086400 [Ceratodon purpureus]|nr:hypothetical protein M758_10G086400 [Ceratodon purpureus]